MTLYQRFFDSIKRGTGEAFLLLKQNPNKDFSKYITLAARKNFAYDPQCEGDRANYLVRLIRITRDPEKIVSSILKALLNPKIKDTWNLDQLFALAYIFAKDGCSAAVSAILKRVKMKPISDSPWLGIEELLKLKGLEGLFLYAKLRGKTLLRNPNTWDDAFIVDSFQEEHPEIKVLEELTKASLENIFIKRYLDEIQKAKTNSPSKSKTRRIDYEAIKENIEAKLIVPASPRAIHGLSNDDLLKLAKDFLMETDHVKLEKYLRIFSWVKFPLSYTSILKLAKGPNPRKTRLVEFACSSLKYFQADDIRKLADEKLSRGYDPTVYLPLLISNYRDGDHRIINRILRKYKSQHSVHNMVWDVIEIYENNITKDCKLPLETLYKKLTCAIHRYDVVKLLIDRKCISKTISEEIPFDCDEGLKELLNNGKTT